MKNHRIIIFLFALSMLATATYAQQPLPTSSPTTVPQPTIKTLDLDSKLMAKKMPYCVILPANYETEKETRFPVIYMLHGLGGSYKVTKLSSANILTSSESLWFCRGRQRILHRWCDKSE